MRENEPVVLRAWSLEPDGLGSNPHPGNYQLYDLRQSMGLYYVSITSSVQWEQCLHLYTMVVAKIRYVNMMC